MAAVFSLGGFFGASPGFAAGPDPEFAPDAVFFDALDWSALAWPRLGPVAPPVSESLGEIPLASIKDRLKNAAVLRLSGRPWSLGLAIGSGPVVDLLLRSQDGRETLLPLGRCDARGVSKGLVRLWRGFDVRLPGSAPYRFRLAWTPLSESGPVALKVSPIGAGAQASAWLPLKPIRDAVLKRAFSFSSRKARYWAFYETPAANAFSDGGRDGSPSGSTAAPAAVPEAPALIILRRGHDGLRWRLLRRFLERPGSHKVSWGDETLVFETRPGGILAVGEIR